MLNIQNLKIENLKLKNRILLGYSIPLAILLGLNGLVFFNNQRVSNALKENEETQQTLETVNEMRHGLNRFVRTFRGYLLDRTDSMEDTYKSYQAGLAAYREAMTQVDSLNLNSEQEKQLKEITDTNSLNTNYR